MEQDTKSMRGMVFLILDNLPVHKTNRVKNWAQENAKKNQLFYLPVYSPELNSDEYLNQDLKAHIVRNASSNSL